MSTTAPSRRAWRSQLAFCTADPFHESTAEAFHFIRDGVVVCENGRFAAVGEAERILPTLGDDIPIEHYPDHIIIPGMVDAHVHYPQHGIIGAYSGELLEWLEQVAFPAEAAFADRAHADSVAEEFLEGLLTNGTTTALVFATVHEASVEAFFTAAARRGLRMICGKVLMDRNAPAALLDTADSGDRQSRALIERWHGHDRLGYAVTPRFALTSSSAQLSSAGRLLEAYPDVLLHTHLCENPHEIQAVKGEFPHCEDYLGVYEAHGLVGSRSVFAHSIHLSEREQACLGEHDAAVAFCPMSNFALGSGLFDLDAARQHRLRVALGSDVGAGNSLSLLRCLDEAYKTCKLRGQRLEPAHALYLATLGGARALGLERQIGSLEVGKEADFVVLDPLATPDQRSRNVPPRDASERLFTIFSLGDDRCVAQTIAAGRVAHRRTAEAIPS